MHGEQDSSGLGLVVVSNRGPVEHYLEPDDQIKARRASGGLVTALSALRKHQEFFWIASAITPGDRRVAKAPSHRDFGRPLKRTSYDALRSCSEDRSSSAVDFVVVPEDVFHRHYEVFSNRILWFLQHSMWDQLKGRIDKNIVGEAWWNGYVPTNVAFARSVAARVSRHKMAVVMLHDYHLYLAPHHIRQQFPDAVLQHFVHIPWPVPEAWQVLPLSLSRGICRSLLANDIVGFQTTMSAHNFLHCCDRLLEDAEVDYVHRTVKFRNRLVYVRVYPISVDVNELRRAIDAPVVKQHQERLRQLCGDLTIARVDRLDPSKNIARGFQAFEQLLLTRPEFQGKVKFLAFLVPSRTRIVEYERCYKEIMSLVQGINAKFGRDGFRPIEVFYENDYHQALAGMSLCDVLLVNPVADGMNLVAKEGPIVSTRDSVLVLSRTAGAFEQLIGGALSIDPTDVDRTADALASALTMTSEERRERSQFLRERIAKEDISNWIRMQLDDIARVLAERVDLSCKQLERSIQPGKAYTSGQRKGAVRPEPASKRRANEGG